MRNSIRYISAAAVFFLTAAVLVAITTPLSVDERASGILVQQYENIGTLDSDDTVVYDKVTPDYVLTYAENQIEEYPTTQAGYRFAQLVNIKSHGKIQVRIYADSELGDEASAVEQLRMGGVDLARVSLSLVSNYNKESVALMMPYIYRDADHMWAILGGEIGERMMDGFDGSGFTALSWFDAGVRSLYFRTPVQNMTDLKGLWIRVQDNALMQDMIRQIGAEPVTMDYEEVYSALDQETIDGAENNWPSYVAMAHDKVAPYYLEDAHMRVPELQILSDVTAEALGEENVGILRTCAEEAADYERYLWKNYEAQAREDAIAAGATRIALTNEEKQEFIDAVEPLYEQYCGEFMDLVDEIRSTQP